MPRAPLTVRERNGALPCEAVIDAALWPTLIPQDTPKLWVFVLEAQPLPEAPEFQEFGGAYVLCYQMPGLAADPVHHASEFLREAGWRVIGVQEEPEQRDRGDAPEYEHFDQALIDDEAYVFHQWRVEDADDQTRH